MMGAFNRLPFNRVASVDIYGGFVVDVSGDVFMFANIEAHDGFVADLSADIVFEAFREQFGRFVLDAISFVDFSATRERTGRFAVEASLEISFSAGRYHVDHIEFTGEFKPGDQIVIDSEKLKMTLNGENALQLMQGDFFDLVTGKNELVYTDDQTGRTVRMRITFKDRFV
jgi:hypothetical protein